MNKTAIIALGTFVVGAYAGHTYGHWHAEHEMHEGEMEGMEEMEGMSKDTPMKDMPAMDMSKMNPEGLPMGIHNHPMREVDQSLPIPEVAITSIKDAMDGYNIQLATKNFTFTPELINTEPVANQGHAHIYVNGTKISRLYGPWFNLSDKHLEEGINTIEVTLNANDHSEWAVEGTHIQSIIKLTK